MDSREQDDLEWENLPGKKKQIIGFPTYRIKFKYEIVSQTGSRIRTGIGPRLSNLNQVDQMVKDMTENNYIPPMLREFHNGQQLRIVKIIAVARIKSAIEEQPLEIEVQ